MSTFSGLSTALSALQAQQRALDVTGQNLANAATTGYTRQRVNMTERAAGGASLWGGTQVRAGSGVEVTSISRLNDPLADAAAVSAHGNLGLATSQADTLDAVQGVFNEPSDDGLADALSNYWSAWGDVSTNTTNPSVRNSLLSTASTLTGQLNSAASQLSQRWNSELAGAQSTVASINATAASIASLNQKIQAATTAGSSPNELEDQRDNLVMSLADTAGVTTRTHTDGSVDVLLDGSSLVSGGTARSLALGGASALAGVDSSDPSTGVTLTWADSGTAATITGGSLGGSLAALNSTLPGYADKLDAVADTLVANVNAQQAAGYDADGNPGTAFFSTTPGGSSALTIKVAITDPDQVAASGTAPTTDSSGNVVTNTDGSNAAILAQFGQATMPTGAALDAGSYRSPDTAYQQLVAVLGVQASSATTAATAAGTVSTAADQARADAGGVSTDEELTNMLTYQHAYEGAARYMSVVSEVLDTLINKTV